MNLTDTKAKFLFVALFAVLFLAGCGAKKSGPDSSDLGSTSLDATGKAVAECSKDSAGLGDFEVRLTAYKDSYGRVMPQFVRMQIKKMPEQFKSENWEISTYRWTADASGHSDLDADKLPLFFQARYNGAFDYLKTNSSGQVIRPYQIIDFTHEVEPIGQLTNIPTTTAQSFFDVASFIVDLKDSQGTYQVLRVVLRKSGAIQKEVNVLIPNFCANPATYNADPRHPEVLQQLHPLKSLVGQSWTEEQYKGFTQSWCL